LSAKVFSIFGEHPGGAFAARSAVCSITLSGQAPKPHGGAPKARGLTAKARIERRSACSDAWPSDTVREIEYQIFTNYGDLSNLFFSATNKAPPRPPMTRRDLFALIDPASDQPQDVKGAPARFAVDQKFLGPYVIGLG
jgi:hypothetical protein